MERRPTAWSACRVEPSPLIGSILIWLTAAGVIVAEFSGKLSKGSLPYVVPVSLVIGFCALLFVFIRFFILAEQTHRDTIGALDTTERKYKSVFDSALDGFLVFDRKGTCIEANAAVCRLLGVASRDLIGERVPDFLFIAGQSNAVRDHRPSYRRERAEAKLLQPGGGTAIVEYTVSPNFIPGLHVAVLRDITRRKEVDAALRESEHRFQQMAENIQEVFWMIDAKTRRVLYVNSAFEAITGLPGETVIQSPESLTEILHPEDRTRILSHVDEALQSGDFDEEFRTVKPDGAVRWVWVRASPVNDGFGIFQWFVGSAQDVTGRKLAEQAMARNFALAEAARAETEALRKTSLALTENLRMDYVLDTLLQALLGLVPCESAQIMLVEAGTHLFLAREVANYRMDRFAPGSPETFDAQESRHLIQILTRRESALVADTADEPDWPSFSGFSHLRSWLCVPLIGSNEVLGLLSLGDTHPQAFSEEHLRLATSLAIPAAVAIQNARLYEQTEIFRSELEQQLAGAQQIEEASGQLRRSSEAS